MTMNAAEALLAGGDPQHDALACGDERITFDALRDSVARAASTWRRMGLARGDRVAVKLPDGIPWVVAFLGAIWAGGVAVPVNPRLPPDDWRTILGDAGFRFILAEAPGEAPPAYRDRVVVNDAWMPEVAIAAPVAPEAMDDEAPAFWGHSSGTTGKPKAVVHPQRFALHCQRVAAEILKIGSGDRLFASSKLFFAYPQANSLFSGLKQGATVILAPEWPTAAGVAAIVARERPSVFFTVPSMYRNLLKEGYAPEFRDCGIRTCVSAGEALSARLREEWRRQANLPIVDGYGASETLCLVLVDAEEGGGFRPAPGVLVRALNEGDDGAPTRILIEAPTLSLGYFERPEAQAEHFRHGAFCPADLFERSDHGAWRFGGREDSLVKIRGRWVNLVELEERLAAACPGIAEAAAVTTPDSDGVGAIAFFYVRAADAPADAVDLALRVCTETLSPHQRPQWLRAVPALPRTATGKLLRRKLQEMHRA